MSAYRPRLPSLQVQTDALIRPLDQGAFFGPCPVFTTLPRGLKLALKQSGASMANPEHINRLLEGVEAWNARRKKDDSRPDFGGVDIRGAFEEAGKLSGIRRYDLNYANLWAADLWGAVLREADLWEADLWEAVPRGANVRTVNLAVKMNDGNTARFTDLSTSVNLTQSQVDAMLGDSGTILPDSIKRPEHWPQWQENGEPALPEQAELGDGVSEDDGKIALNTGGNPPPRHDLAILFQDLKTEVANFQASGNLDNVSRSFAGALNRFLDIIPDDYADLEQVRFGVASTTTRMRFASSKDEIEATAP